MTEQRIEFSATGCPEVLRLVPIDLPPPAAGEVRLRIRAIGVNYIDTYHRGGLYPLPLPSGLGVEAAGVVEAVGAGVTALVPGQRVGLSGGGPGSYATARNVPADLLVPLPDDIADETAAALMLKGSTVEALVERCAKVQPGSTVLVHAAAGGVGLLMVQWLKALGCTVIGTAGGEAKLALARQAGADHLIDYNHEDIAARVREITGGEGVPVVFDGVGKDTWEASLAATAVRGLIVSFGNASGPVTGVGLGALAAAGSLFVTRPTVFHYQRDAAERAAAFARVFAMVQSGALDVRIGQRFALADAAEAHRALESRATTGSTILMP
ncbi:quinone oxidoreductase [Novosphingobium flavum]|uniref:Quinone oxidoreductase n=1 Tax=Novosphingobium flavum TaxID=1778672 RepID=A0A7X1FSR0_9SPHN|nr:quinone oxidoreductase [Novosphingobium flavum]MBC2666276.1 quinone oxidoreductase [Novosphingobium flavum]